MWPFLAHTYQVVNNDTSFPIWGTPTSALLFALGFTGAVLFLYLVIDRLPKSKKNRVPPKAEPNYAKAMVSIIAVAGCGMALDAWWHQAVGIDTIFVTPHLLLYTCVAAIICLGFYVWRHTRDQAWKHIFFVSLFLPISFAFDNFFHTIWGFEDLTRPLYLSWSPGHMAILISVIAILILVLEVLFKFRKTQDFDFFGNLSFALIFGAIGGMLLPFIPTGPWGQVAGFAGVGVIALVYLFVLLSAEKTMQGNIDATLVSIFVVVLAALFITKDKAESVSMLPHDHPPFWLIAFGLLATAILLDVTKNRFPMWIRGMFGGIVFSGIIFGFAPIFLKMEFQYGGIEIAIATVFSAMAGLVAGSVFGLFHLEDEKHIANLFKKF